MTSPTEVVGQLVMARKGDEGPYHPDNVFKLLENVREYCAA